MQANMWLGTLLLERSEDIYRMKGLLSVEGMPERFVFQVSSRFTKHLASYCRYPNSFEQNLIRISFELVCLVSQGVHDIFQGSPDRLWGADEPRVNKLVFIGKNLNAQELEKGFKACLIA